MFSEEVVKRLQEKLEAIKIKERLGAGQRLKYLKGDTVIDTANAIFGFGQWGYKILSCEYMPMPEGKGIYRAYIELSVAGAAFPFPGDGVGTVSSQQIAHHEKAIKEASTDALKRAFRHLGDQFGLSLYDEDDYVINADGEEVKVKDLDKPAPAVRQQQSRPQQTPQAQRPQAQQPQRVAPAKQDSDPNKITQQQIDALTKIYANLKEPLPENIASMSMHNAGNMIISKSTELKERNRARNAS